jgi:hypothetical protein
MSKDVISRLPVVLLSKGSEGHVAKALWFVNALEESLMTQSKWNYETLDLRSSYPAQSGHFPRQSKGNSIMLSAG